MSSMNAMQFLRDRFFDFRDDNKLPIELAITRQDLARLFNEMGFRSGAEIGVERGEYSEILLQSNPGLHLIMVDPWKTIPGYREHVSQEKLDAFRIEALDRTSKYDRWVIQEESAEASKYVSDGSLDFVYIDANHEFLHVAQDIALWEKKVRPGGIVAGHDFVRRKNRRYSNHVKDVVQAWTYSHGIRPWFVCRGDRSPSWFWIKQLPKGTL